MVGVWLVVLASSSILYGIVSCLIVKKTNRLTQAVVFFRRHFLCGALLCNCSSAEREGLSTHVQRECPAEPFMRSILSQRIFTPLPVLAYDFLSRCKFSTPTGTPLYRSTIRLYPQNPVFEIDREESVKVYLHMHNGNVQQNPICVESCVTEKFAIPPRFSPTIFDPDANSVLLAHLCTAVDSLRRKPYVRNCSRECRGLYNGNIQQNPLCAASCVTKDIPIPPRFSRTFFNSRANPAPYSAPFLYTPAQVDAPCRLEAHYARNKNKIKNVTF